MMQKISGWLRRAFGGCYGVDQLSVAILIVDLVLCTVGIFTRVSWISLLSYIPMGIVLFRMLSRNKYQRNRENRRFLQILDRIKDRRNRYFRCPKCRQMVRVPGGKGRLPSPVPGAGSGSLRRPSEGASGPLHPQARTRLCMSS